MKRILVSVLLAVAMLSGSAIVSHADEEGPSPTKKVQRVRHRKAAPRVMQQAPTPPPVMAVAPAPVRMVPTLCPGQPYIMAEAWTTTPMRSARAGFSGLPLRNCEGMYCGELAKLPIGTQVDVLVDDREGWALVHVPSTDMCGWVNTNNIFQNTCGPAL
ncbi:MAG: SH3 domain-containing protein [Acidobacteriota bacterium]